MEFECGHKVSRGEVWIATHKHANGEFVNDKAREIGEKIEAYQSSGSISKDISSEDSLAKALGSEEHCGRVRGLGLGPCPTRVFGHTVRSYNGITSSSTSYKQLQNQVSEGFPNMAIFQVSPASDRGSAQPTNVPNHSPNDSEHNQE
ncbi:hypothetical protein VNO78_16543 [Psophocarpus tetragonolobus]|uniref:Uncharacterized protein n=1 Tax=Psophocarpus tetragonolobus TaxID=3891 RepID=A0AAN9SFV9_PSOTE